MAVGDRVKCITTRGFQNSWLTPCERVKILCILSLCKHLISRNALTSAGSCGQLLFVGTLICKGLRKI